MIRSGLHLTVRLILLTAFSLAFTLLWVATLTNANAASRGITITARSRTGATRNLQLYSGYHALVVGCGEYRAGWPRLPNPVKDAREVAAALKKLGCEVNLLEDPDWSTLRRALNELITGPGRNPDKAILFWFSGHGHTLKEVGGRELGYIVPVDAPNPDRDEIGFMETAISMRQIETLARRIRARHTLMLFDSCFSGAIFQAVRSKPSPYIEEKVQQPVRQFITAGNQNEQVPDDSVFKTVFIQSISQGYADRNTDGYVTGMELGDYLQEQVVNYSRGAQHPQFGKINDPALDKGDFVFLLASSGTVIETPSTPSSTQGRLSVTANVADAEVIVDGRFMGKTPLSGIEVPGGSHRVQVKKEGHDTYRATIEVVVGRTASLEAYLAKQGPKTGRLYVGTTPGNAKVKILNIGPKYYHGMELESGSYHVEVSADGHDKQTRWVTLAAGEDKRLDFRLSAVAVSRTVTKLVAPQATKKETGFTNSLGMSFVYIEPGSFSMGSPSNESGRNTDERQHQVTLTRGYYMQTTEVTQGQWQRVMGSNPSQFKNCGDDCPVEQVSWKDVHAFIRKLNQIEGTDTYRLPTEAEWEYSARAGSQTALYSGGIRILGVNNAPALDPIAWYGGNSCVDYSGGYDCSGWKEKQRSCTKCGPHPVARKTPNSWGLYDMIGNVWEWCQDWYGDYPSGAVTNPQGPSSGEFRVGRGSSWDYFAGDCRSAGRLGSKPGFRINNLGFRLSRTP